MILYIPGLLLPSSQTELLLAVMALTSLASSAWILWVVPLPGEKEGGEVKVPGLGTFKRNGSVEGPVRKYIGYLNLALCGILALTGERLLEGKESPSELIWWMLPGGGFCVWLFPSGSRIVVFLAQQFIRLYLMCLSLV